eukprot:snap_masked-scaffold_85-processed-gene-0.3-mRNA-1 protein AED:1.00 eAED:1.00 QI:0/-1/0/0/-1/1/1/0/85
MLGVGLDEYDIGNLVLRQDERKVLKRCLKSLPIYHHDRSTVQKGKRSFGEDKTVVSYLLRDLVNDPSMCKELEDGVKMLAEFSNF